MNSRPALTLVLLPGMDGTGELFAPIMSELSTHTKIIAVGYPTSTIMSYAELVAYVQSYIPKDSPYILLGESFSGPIAISLAARADKHLKGLILSCTFACNPRPLMSKLSFLLPTLPIDSWLFPSVCKVLMGRFDNDKVRTLFATAISKVAARTIRARLDMVIGVNYSEMLENIQVPILYLQARHDYLVPNSAAKLIKKYAKNVELVTLDAPHLLLQVAAKEATRFIRAFLEKL